MTYGIICEFNPFHQGHKHLIDTIKSENNNVICVMSGNYVQRGEFAVMDKWSRAKSAIEGGADLVIELPTVYSTMSAEGFAKSGVKLLESTGVVDNIAFGAECDDIEKLKEVSLKLKDYYSEIREELKSGVSFPVARKKVIGSGLLDSPNNILAMEYINATTLPCTAVKRVGLGHDSEDINYSASAIRKTMNGNDIASIYNCEKAVIAKLRTMSPEDFREINDVSEGLENRIYDAVRKATSIDEIYTLIKTKRYTHSRIRRIILRSYLGITRHDVSGLHYIRILAFNEKGMKLLAEMKKTSKLPVISRYQDVKSMSAAAQKQFQDECKYTDLYNLGYKKPLPCGTEQTACVIMVTDN